MAIAGCDAGDGEGEGFGFSFALGAMAAIHCAVRFHSFCDGFASFFLAISPLNGRRDSGWAVQVLYLLGRSYPIDRSDSSPVLMYGPN